MANRDPEFDGSYQTSRYAKHSLEDDILDAGCGKITSETSSGGLYRQTDTRIDVWGKGSPGDYSHYYYDSTTGECGTKTGKR